MMLAEGWAGPTIFNAFTLLGEDNSSQFASRRSRSSAPRACARATAARTREAQQKRTTQRACPATRTSMLQLQITFRLGDNARIHGRDQRRKHPARARASGVPKLCSDFREECGDPHDRCDPARGSLQSATFM